MELEGLPCSSMAMGMSPPGPGGWSGSCLKKTSRLLLKASLVPVKSLMTLGRALNSLGPSVQKEWSLRVWIETTDPDNVGTIINLPLLVELEAMLSPQLGTMP